MEIGIASPGDEARPQESRLVEEAVGKQGAFRGGLDGIVAPDQEAVAVRLACRAQEAQIPGELLHGAPGAGMAGAVALEVVVERGKIGQTEPGCRGGCPGQDRGRGAGDPA